MATGSSTIPRANGPPPPPPPAGKLMEYEQFIDRQLRKTRSQVRMVDVISGLLILATSTLGYFFALALVDHWVIAGGLPGWARIIALGSYAVVAGWYFVTRLLPLFIKRINPLYAAETIERTQPSLKNGLLNFLMFRARPQGLQQSVYQAIEAQAASNLAHVHIESVVDRSKLLKIGYVLAAVFAVCAIYKVVSPKDPLTSVGRVVMPWADILPPTRVVIEKIEPGDAKAFRGQEVTVSAEVRGLERDGKVTLFYTTVDGQTVDRAVEMHVPKDGYRYTCKVPPDESGIQQTLRYRIVAGDAKSHDHTLSVVAAPTIVVDSIEYSYPEYTGFSSQKIEHQGDLNAIEGTRVLVHAVTNQPIKRGGIDFECDGSEDLRLAPDGTGDLARGAAASFALTLEKDRVSQTHSSYQLRFQNAEGDENPEPIRYSIRVVPDLAPEIEFLAPKEDEVLMREGDALPIELSASDPDFALKNVKLIAEVDGRRLFEKSFVKEPRRGQLNSKFRLSSKEHSLKAGDVVEYWAVAEDIKYPAPNVVETAKRRVRIVPRDAKGQPNKGEEGEKKQPPLEGEPEEQPKGKEGEQGKDEVKPDEGKSGETKGNEQEQKSGDKSQDQSKGDKGESGEKGQGEEGSQKEEKGESGSEEPKEDSSGEQSKDSPDDKSGKPNDGKSDKGEKSGSGKNDSKSGGEEKKPIANDGTEDGEAFDKALEHLDKQKQNSGGKNDQPDGAETKDKETGGPKSENENKQTPGENGGQPKPNDKKPPSEDLKEDSSKDDNGNKDKGESKPGESDNAKESKGDQGGGEGHEQQAESKDNAKQGDNSQEGKPAEGASKNAQREEGDPGKDGKAEKTDQQPSGKGDPRDGEADSGNPRDQNPGKESPQPGKGDQSKGDDRSKGDKPDPKKSRPDSQGGSSEEEKGESGAGRSGEDNKGAPEAQGDNKQRDKVKKESGGQQDDEGKTEPQSPSNSNKQSDSEGQSDGDKSGGGKEGGGQKANQPGTGGAGKNTASDEGAGRSDEQGTGETGDQAGEQQETNTKTGKSGKNAGEGSQTKPGDKSGGGEQNNKPNSNDPQKDGQPSEGAPGQQGGKPGDGTKQGAERGAQAGKENTPPEQQKPQGEPGGDKANLEYARKATDLALEHLRDQLKKGEPDQELLDELGWTRDDLEKFIRRWDQMRAAAKDPTNTGKESKRELDATLKSLGLQPRGSAISGSRGTDDTQRGLKESRRSSPPKEYADDYKEYLKSTARGGK